MKKLKNFFIKNSLRIGGIMALICTFLYGSPLAVMAQDGETLYPAWIQTIIDQVTDKQEEYINERVQFGLTVLFVVVFIVAIVYSALAAIKFMSSQGDSGKLEESKGAVKAILMGFAAMILAIVGIFVILWILGAGEAQIDDSIPEPPF